MKKAISILAVVFAVMMVLALPISASSPYYTYTYSISGNALRSPDAYTPEKKIDAEAMGLTVEGLRPFYPGLSDEELVKKTELKTMTDLETDENGNVYIADMENNRVIVLTKEYKLKFIIEDFKKDNGNPDKLSTPHGVFITKTKVVNGVEIPGKIYVCDTGNKRILTFTLDGEFVSDLGTPQSDVITLNTYNPQQVAVDRYDRLYVVTTGTDGIMVLTKEGEFTSYIGAQKASVSFWDRIVKRLKSNEQKEQDVVINPTPYSNITLVGDFIYVTISDEIMNPTFEAGMAGKSKDGASAPVRMLNAAGQELMRRNGFFPPSGEVDFVPTIMAATDNDISGVSEIADVAAGPYNTWSIIDRKRSKVYTYDFDGNLLFAFGDRGELLGNIKEGFLDAITYQGDKILLLDTDVNNRSFTVYKLTDYGKTLMSAIDCQNRGLYTDAIENWEEVLKLNSNFDAAYIGIGNSYYRSQLYEEAIEQYKNAYDTTNYSLAFGEYRQQLISEYIWAIPIIAIVLIVAILLAVKYITKVNKRAETAGGKRTYWEELLFAFHVIFHPFDGFWDLKHEKRGSVRAGTTILVLAVASIYYQSTGAPYIVNPQQTFMSLFTAVTTVCVPLALFVLGNWCITTLFEGEGSFKDIYIASTYSLTPLLLVTVPTTLASYFVLESELAIISFITTIGFIWLGLLLFLGTMVVHDYTIGKNIVTTLATLVAMIFIMFLVLLFSTLIGKMVSFVTNLVTELKYYQT